MILLDTSVLSALMRATPDPAVIDWLDRQPAESIGTTTITVFEVRSTLVSLMEPQRRTLEELFELVLQEIFAERILPFDLAAAQHAATLVARHVAPSHPLSTRDLQVAGIALASNATIATCYPPRFADFNVSVVDPRSAQH